MSECDEYFGDPTAGLPDNMFVFGNQNDDDYYDDGGGGYDGIRVAKPDDLVAVVDCNPSGIYDLVRYGGRTTINIHAVHGPAGVTGWAFGAFSNAWDYGQNAYVYKYRYNIVSLPAVHIREQLRENQSDLHYGTTTEKWMSLSQRNQCSHCFNKFVNIQKEVWIGFF